MDRCVLFITGNNIRDLKCIKPCDCKASEVLTHGVGCVFFANKNKDHIGELIENRSLTKLAKYTRHLRCGLFTVQNRVTL